MIAKKPKLKAYKIAFPKLLDGKTPKEHWSKKDPEFEVCYGENWGDAVNKCCTNLSEYYTFFELKINATTRRFKELDRYEQPKSQILENVDSRCIDLMLHSLGVEIDDICPKEFYRNHFFSDTNDKDLLYLVNLGLMEQGKQLEHGCYYRVTEKGIKAIKTLLYCTKEQIEK